MKKLASELTFISQINRDGSGTIPVPLQYLKAMIKNPLMNKERFKIMPLSMSQQTYIAHGFNAFVVKLK